MDRTQPVAAGPPSDLRPALDAAYRGAEDEVLEALLLVTLREGASASPDELWLGGELAFLEGRYAESIERFETFESGAREWRVPAWQRFGSAHRRAIALFRDGQYQRSRQALAEAERIVASAPELAFRKPNIDAMHGHFLEIENDLDGARACFVLAFQGAFDFRNWSRAASVAVDVARIAIDQGIRPDALTWLEEARMADEREPSRRVRQLIELGLAKVYQLARPREAQAIYDRLLEEPIPDRDVNALRERAEIRTERGDFSEAEEDLRRAIALCEERGVRLVAMDVYRALAYLYAARKAPGDLPNAASTFQRYATIALSSPQPKPQLLVALAEGVLSNPETVGLRPRQVKPIRAALEKYRALMARPNDGRALRGAKFKAALHDLDSALRFLAEPDIETKQWRILPGPGRIVPRDGSGASTPITPRELSALYALLKAPSPGFHTTDLAHALNLSYDAANKAVERLRVLLGTDLVSVTLPGNFKAFSIARPDS